VGGYGNGGVQAILVDVIEGVRWEEYMHKEFLKEFIRKKPKKTEKVMIRLAPREKEEWGKRARGEGMNLSEWIRHVVRRYTGL